MDNNVTVVAGRSMVKVLFGDPAKRWATISVDSAEQGVLLAAIVQMAVATAKGDENSAEVAWREVVSACKGCCLLNIEPHAEGLSFNLQGAGSN